MELVQTVCYASPFLKEKFEKRIAKKKFPKDVKPEFKYDLAFECEPPKFPNLPSADFALSFFPLTQIGSHLGTFLMYWKMTNKDLVKE